MLSTKKDFIKINEFQVFPVLVDETDVLALTCTKSPCLVLLRPSETSLMLCLYGNGFMKRAFLFGFCRHTSQK